MTRPRSIDDAQVLEVTRRLLLERGLQISTRAIAAEIGISEGILFQRFGSKDGLIRAALVLPEIDAGQTVAESAKGENAQEVLQNIGVAVFEAFRRLLPLYVPLIAQPVFGTERVLSSRTSPFTMFQTALERHLTGERHAGRIWTDSPHRASYLLVSVLHNAALLETVAGSSSDMSEGKIRDLMGIIWKGLEPR